MDTILQDFLNHKKDKWKDETINNIRKMLLGRNESLIPSSQIKTDYTPQPDDKEEKPAVVIGETQVGKSTLIMDLIGIKRECAEEVGQILRAERQAGTSSTSTAMIYKKSENNDFVITVDLPKTVSDSKINKKERFRGENPQGFIAELKRIRANVEAQNGTIDGLVHISLPKKYFKEDADNYSNISVLDLPGSGSRGGEAGHAAVQIRSFMNASSANILVCKANNIQALEKNNDTFEYAKDKNWMLHPEKFCLVLTYAYTEDKTFNDLNKDYFSRDIKSKASLSEFMDDYYRKDLAANVSEKLGDKNFKIFPIETGQSLKSKIETDTFKEADRKLVLDTIDNNIEDIRKFIKENKSDSLKYIIDGMVKDVVEYCGEKVKDIEEEQKKSKEEIEILEKSLAKNEGNADTYSENLKEKKAVYNELNNRYRAMEKKRDDIDYISSYDYISEFNLKTDDVFGRLNKIGLFSSSKNKEDNIALLNQLSRNFLLSMTDFLNSTLYDYRNNFSFLFSDYDNSYSSGNSDDDYENYDDSGTSLSSVEDEIKESSASAFKALSEKKFYFDGNNKKKEAEYKRIAKQEFQYAQDKLKIFLADCFDKFIKNNNLEKARGEMKSFEFLKMTNEKKIRDLKNKIKSLENRLNGLEAEKENFKKAEKEGAKISADQKKLAKASFEKQKDEIITKINSTNDRYEKFEYLTCLGVIEFEYNDEILNRGVNENEQ
ncbi:MAG: hypothetical protein LUG66_05775 [Clostridiales bacterium]|nr:hypothetical protein [Clostridiales bacterium]